MFVHLYTKRESELHLTHLMFNPLNKHPLTLSMLAKITFHEKQLSCIWVMEQILESGFQERVTTLIMEHIVFVNKTPWWAGFAVPVSGLGLILGADVKILQEISLATLHTVFICVCVFLKMEIESGAGLTEEYLYEEVHPKPQALKQAFAKPKGPTGKRGNKRLIKGVGENGEES